MANCMLQVKGLKTYYYTEEGVVPAVDGPVSYTHLTLPTTERV